MNKADEMFEELGYEKQLFITYSIMVHGHQIDIEINGITKAFVIKKRYYDKLGNLKTSILRIEEMSEPVQQAINEKVKELGWIE